MKKLASLVLALAMMATFAFPAFAATVKDDPYSYIWEDENKDVWVIQYYEYSRNNGYEISDYVTIDGTKLYDSKGKQITTIKKMTDADEPTAVFDEDGELYFLLSNTSIGHMDKSTDSKYEKASISSASYITVDDDELGTKVGSKNLSSLNFSGSYSRNSSSSSSSNNKSGDYVKTYAYNGDYTKTAYDAYKDDELIITVHTKGSNVWLKQGNKLLSDSCVGAKFVGYSVNYSVILYDLDGTLYYFLYDEDEEELDYNRAHTISLGEEIMSFERDDDGFIIEIETDEDTYDLDEILEDEDDWDDDNWDDDDDIYDNISKVSNSSTKSVAYKSTSKVVAELVKKSNYLYYEDEELDESYRPTYFGFTEDGYPVWINYYGELYYYNGSREKLIEEDVTRLQYDNYGFVYRFYIGSKAYDIEDEI